MNPVRLRLLRAGFAFLFVVIALRLFWVQAVVAGDLREQARSQSRMRLLLEAPRGSILATDGSVLAGERAEGGRGWPWGSMALPMLGLVGRDGAGLQGLEYKFDENLRGTPGWAVARRTAKGEAWPGFDGTGSVAHPGASLVTTLRPTLQGEVEAALREGVDKHRATGGVALVIEARTGDIVAAASYPAPVDRVSMAQGRVDVGMIHRTYEPGSTFKAISLAAGLESGRVRMSDRFHVTGSWVPPEGGRPIRDAHPHEGIFQPAWCLEQSSNVCFAQIALRAGAEQFYRTVRDFGFGTPTGVDLPGEEGGILRTVDQWSGRTLPTMSIGQEITTTALQVAMAYGAIANGGVLMRPRLARAIVDPDGDTLERFPTRPVRRATSETVAAQVYAALETVVDSGTGRLAHLPGLKVAGKTGTSQKVDAASGRYFQDRYVASFIGIVPLRSTPLVCLVVIDDPSANGHTGGLAAAPIFSRIMRFALRAPSLPYGNGAVDAPGELVRNLRTTPVHRDSSSIQAASIEEVPG